MFLLQEELYSIRAEEAKWKDVPAWKKNLILEKEKKAREESVKN